MTFTVPIKHSIKFNEPGTTTPFPHGADNLDGEAAVKPAILKMNGLPVSFQFSNRRIVTAEQWERDILDTLKGNRGGLCE